MRKTLILLLTALLSCTMAKGQDAEVSIEDLAARFIKNFAKFTGNDEGKSLVAAGPQL